MSYEHEKPTLASLHINPANPPFSTKAAAPVHPGSVSPPSYSPPPSNNIISPVSAQNTGDRFAPQQQQPIVSPQSTGKVEPGIQPVISHDNYPEPTAAQQAKNASAGFYAPQDTQPQQPQQAYAGQPQQQQYQGQPQFQGQQGQQRFPNVTPLFALTSAPAPVQCPACGARSMTITNYMTGNMTHVWALVICAVFCLGCIPYLIDGTKDVTHKCGNCGVRLATWHRSGRTEVHMQG